MCKNFYGEKKVENKNIFFLYSLLLFKEKKLYGYNKIKHKRRNRKES